MSTQSSPSTWGLGSRRALIAASIAAVSIGAFADSADAPMPEPHSATIGAAVSDTVITAKVKSHFTGDARLKKSEISVNTTNGVVTLTGSASSSDAKTAAEAIASGVEGVSSVDNELKAPSTADAIATSADKAAKSTEKMASDSWITTKVKSEIMADSMSKGFEVGVETRNGVVALKGTLATQDAIDHVKALAGQVKGVKSVDSTLLTVANS